MRYYKEIQLKNDLMCIVRNGTEQDAENVLANYIRTLGQTEFLSTYPDEITLTAEQEREYLKLKTQSERSVYLVAEVEGAIVGAAQIDGVGRSEKTSHRASFGINIDKERWGLGIGRSMLRSCIECAKAAGYLQVELGVNSDNERAISLYESEGFVEYGRNPKAFHTRSGKWQEDVLMRKEI